MSILSSDALPHNLTEYLTETHIQNVSTTTSIPKQVNDILGIVAEWLNLRNRQEMFIGFRFSGENAATEIKEALERYSSET